MCEYEYSVIDLIERQGEIILQEQDVSNISYESLFSES